MIDQPNAEELLAAMAATLTAEVVPALDGSAQHSARVVANLCGILSREAGGPSAERTVAALSALLDRDGSMAELAAALDERLRTSDAAFDAAAHEVLLDDALRRLRIAKPSYVETG